MVVAKEFTWKMVANHTDVTMRKLQLLTMLKLLKQNRVIQHQHQLQQYL